VMYWLYVEICSVCMDEATPLHSLGTVSSWNALYGLVWRREGNERPFIS
jgi:hypothetical protein